MTSIATPLLPRLHIWGHGRSWIVYTIGARGQRVSMSAWCTSEEQALRARQQLRREGRGL